MAIEVSVPCLLRSGRLMKRTVDAERFRRRGRKVLLKEYAIMAEARRRAGTHAALGRSEIAGSTAKMYRQKGTGNARHGTRKAVQLRGGGVAFAKKPRAYGWAMPKRARRAALEAALRGKLEDGEVRVMEQFDEERPNTRAFAALLDRLEVDASFLVVPSRHRENIWKSCRNLPGSGYRVVADLNAYEVLRHKFLVLDEEALTSLEERFADA